MQNSTLRLAAPVIALMVILGCGGLFPDGGCADAQAIVHNPDHIGSYTGTYHNTTVVNGSTSAKDLQLSLSVDEFGRVRGTATEPSSGQTAEVTGEAYDNDVRCSGHSETAISFRFQFEADPERGLSGTRHLGHVEPWTFSARYLEGGREIGSGNLTLTKNPVE